MYQAVQVSIAGIFGVMFAIFLLYCTVRIAGYLTDKFEKKGSSNE